MKANKVGQDFNHTGIKYSHGAVDIQPYPRWMPALFWGGVAVVIGIIVWGLS